MNINDILRPDIGRYFAGVFWLVVLIQFLVRWKEKSHLKKTTACPACGEKDLQVEIATLGYDLEYVTKADGKIKVRRSKEMSKISLIKNIGGGILSLSLAVVILSLFYILAKDLLTGANVTGIQNEPFKIKLASPIATLVLGVPLIIIGIAMIVPYFLKKEKQITLTCKQCLAVFGMDGVIISQGEVENPPSDSEEVESSQPGGLQAESAPLAASQASEAASESMEPCQKCGSLIETTDLTCPYCGHTQWSVIAVMAVFSLLMIVFVVYRVLKGTSSGFFFWGGAVVGAAVFATTIHSVYQALQRPK